MSTGDTSAIKRNATILANAAALTSGLVGAIGDKVISKSINNQSLTRDKVEHLVLSKVTSKLAE